MEVTVRFLDWLFVDWQDTARRAIYTTGESFLLLNLARVSDINLDTVDMLGWSIIGGALSVALAGVRGQWNKRRTS